MDYRLSERMMVSACAAGISFKLINIAYRSSARTAGHMVLRIVGWAASLG